MRRDAHIQQHVVHDIAHRTRQKVAELIPEQEAVHVVVRPARETSSDADELTRAEAAGLVQADIRVGRLRAVLVHKGTHGVEGGV